MQKKNEKSPVSKLTYELVTDILEKINEGDSSEKIRQKLHLHHTSWASWVKMAMLDDPAQLSPELLKLRDAIRKRLNGTSLVGMILSAASEKQRKTTRKVTRLLAVPKTELETLSKIGELEFVERCQKDGVLLKVEETETVEPAITNVTSLVDKLLKICEDDIRPEDVQEQVFATVKVSDNFPEV